MSGNGKLATDRLLREASDSISGHSIVPPIQAARLTTKPTSMQSSVFYDENKNELNIATNKNKQTAVVVSV